MNNALSGLASPYFLVLLLLLSCECKKTKQQRNISELHDDIKNVLKEKNIDRSKIEIPNLKQCRCDGLRELKRFCNIVRELSSESLKGVTMKCRSLNQLFPDVVNPRSRGKTSSTLPRFLRKMRKCVRQVLTEFK